MGPELRADPALGARDVGNAPRARHAPSWLGGARRGCGGCRDAGEILVGVSAGGAGARSARAPETARVPSLTSAMADRWRFSHCARAACDLACPGRFPTDHLGGHPTRVHLV